MSTLNSIGLDKTKSKELADLLNDLLANYSLFYQNTRGYHWNIKGKKFFELHVKFEELYNDIQQCQSFNHRLIMKFLDAGPCLFKESLYELTYRFLVIYTFHPFFPWPMVLVLSGSTGQFHL